MTFKQYVTEYFQRMTQLDIQNVEDYIDQMFHDKNIDVVFTTHFKQRLMDRNIQEDELIELFTKLYTKYSDKIKKDEFKAIVFDLSQKLNMPIVVEWDKNDKEFDLVSKTIVRRATPLEANDRPVINV